MNPPPRTFRSQIHFAINEALLPAKLLIPQPIIKKIPGLTSNEDIRLGNARRWIRGSLLDIGCGNNRLVKEYRTGGGDAVGVDVYPWENVDMVLEDPSRLPFSDENFDTVTIIAAINHIPCRREMLKEAHRVLRPDGRLIITNLTPFVSFLWHKWTFWGEHHERGMAEGEVWGLTRKEMGGLLDKTSFELCLFQRFSLGLNQLYVARPMGRSRLA